MSTTSQEMQAYYASRAPYYDAVYLKPERQEDIAFLSAHLPERFRNRHVLEIACGTGTGHNILPRPLPDWWQLTSQLNHSSLPDFVQELRALNFAKRMHTHCHPTLGNSMPLSQGCGFHMCRSAHDKIFCADYMHGWLQVQG